MLADGLVLGYGRHVALDRATFAVPVGATVALIGPNGSGKSTLLRAIAGLVRPRAGRLEVPARQRRADVALVLQTTDVDRSLPITVRETVAMARYARRGPWRPMRAEDRRAVDDALDQLRMADLATRQLHELSGGQRQRALVAQGLAQGAELLLLDEPVTGLDHVSRELILEAVERLRAEGRTVLLSTHDFADARRCDLVLLLAGRVVSFGPPHAVLVDAPLTEAYGGQLLRFGDGGMVLDDPHHHDGHGHGHPSGAGDRGSPSAEHTAGA